MRSLSRFTALGELPDATAHGEIFKYHNILIYVNSMDRHRLIVFTMYMKTRLCYGWPFSS